MPSVSSLLDKFNGFENEATTPVVSRPKSSSHSSGSSSSNGKGASLLSSLRAPVDAVEANVNDELPPPPPPHRKSYETTTIGSQGGDEAPPPAPHRKAYETVGFTGFAPTLEHEDEDEHEDDGDVYEAPVFFAGGSGAGKTSYDHDDDGDGDGDENGEGTYEVPVEDNVEKTSYDHDDDAGSDDEGGAVYEAPGGEDNDQVRNKAAFFQQQAAKKTEKPKKRRISNMFGYFSKVKKLRHPPTIPTPCCRATCWAASMHLLSSGICQTMPMPKEDVGSAGMYTCACTNSGKAWAHIEGRH